MSMLHNNHNNNNLAHANNNDDNGGDDGHTLPPLDSPPRGFIDAREEYADDDAPPGSHSVYGSVHGSVYPPYTDAAPVDYASPTKLSSIVRTQRAQLHTLLRDQSTSQARIKHLQVDNARLVTEMATQSAKTLTSYKVLEQQSDRQLTQASAIAAFYSELRSLSSHGRDTAEALGACVGQNMPNMMQCDRCDLFVVLPPIALDSTSTGTGAGTYRLASLFWTPYLFTPCVFVHALFLRSYRVCGVRGFRGSSLTLTSLVQARSRPAPCFAALAARW